MDGTGSEFRLAFWVSVYFQRRHFLKFQGDTSFIDHFFKAPRSLPERKDHGFPINQTETSSRRREIDL